VDGANYTERAGRASNGRGAWETKAGNEIEEVRSEIEEVKANNGE